MQFLDWFKTPMLHWGIYELTRQQAAELEQRLKTRRTPAARFAGEDTLANHDRFMTRIRPCRDDDPESIVAIINTAAEAYRGVIPADRWHEPYMPRAEFDREIAAGVVFYGYEADGKLAGVMGLQSVGDVNLIRHAYVLPGRQRRGIGGALLEHLRQMSTRRILVGTWEAAHWAVSFYRLHGFELVAPTRKTLLLKTYWSVPDRQIEVSAVLASPHWMKLRSPGCEHCSGCCDKPKIGAGNVSFKSNDSHSTLGKL